MSGLFKKPKVPTVPSVAPPVAPVASITPVAPVAEYTKAKSPFPKAETKAKTTPLEVQKEEEKKKIRGGRRRRATLLTGPRGILEPPKISRKTLLGE